MDEPTKWALLMIFIGMIIGGIILLANSGLSH